MASNDPLEPGSDRLPSDRTDDHHVPASPHIRRDEEMPAVTGELSHDLLLSGPGGTERPMPVRPSWLDQEADEPGDDITPIATRTSGGTVVTFPPRSAPGTGPGEIGRITTSVPATPPQPFDHPSQPPPSAAETIEDDDRAAPAAPAPPQAPVRGRRSEPATPVPPSAPEIGSAPLVAPEETGRGPRVRARKIGETGPAVRAERGQGFLTDPDPGNKPGDAADDGGRSVPWHLIDPQDLARPTAAPDDPLSAPAEEDDDEADRIADLEYLFASRTIDIGGPDTPSLSEEVTPDQGDTTAHGSDSVDGPDPVDEPHPADDAGSVDEFESDESLDELLADFSLATGQPIPTPAPTIPAGPPVQRRLRTDDTPPPGAPGGLLFDGVRSGRHEMPATSTEKSPAEVFASETSLLPARTRRGDERLADGQIDQGRWFNHSSELPVVQVSKGSGPVPKPKRRKRRVVVRFLMTMLMLAALAGIMYLALNSVYL